MEVEKTVLVKSNINEILEKAEKLRTLLEEAKHLVDELASSDILEFEIKS